MKLRLSGEEKKMHQIGSLKNLHKKLSEISDGKSDTAISLFCK